MKKTYSYRMDEKTRAEFEEVCNALGINTSSAINIFANAVIQRREIPFNIKDTREKKTSEDN